MDFFTFRLPVKKHIQKFYSALHGDPIPISTETDLGFVILNTIASRIESKVCRGYNNQFQNPYTATLIFRLPIHYFYCTKKEISIYTCILLNRYLENKFEEDFCNFVQISTGIFGQKRKTSIEAFCRTHNIEIEADVNYDTLKKIEFRYRQKNTNNFLRRLSPVIPSQEKATA